MSSSSFIRLITLAIACFYLLGNANLSYSQQVVSPSTQTALQNSIDVFLNPDGSLKKNINGSFDAKGLRMATGKNGEPIFRKESKGAVVEDENWDNSASNGIVAKINAIAINGTEIYVAAGNVFKWDGIRWIIVGDLFNGSVSALVFNGGLLYAGGTFTNAGGVPANNIAVWNGNAWSAMGLGFDSTVSALAFMNNQLYAGGAFTTSGSVTVNRIARWNGTSWSALGSGMNRDVRCLFPYGLELYAGGNFTSAGGSSANRIAKWNGYTWSALGSGVDSTVLSIAVHQGLVYAGGMFNSAGGLNARHIARWNGTNWFQLSAGLAPNIAYVSSVIVHQNSVHIAYQNVAIIDGPLMSTILKWNILSWTNVATQDSIILGSVNTLTSDGSNLYAGGWFNEVGNIFALNIVKRSNNSWSSIGNAINGQVQAVAVMGNNVYVGGHFYSAGGLNANGIAKWNGTSWSTLGPVGFWPLGVFINCILIDGNDIYVGGQFTQIGGVAAYNIAKWDGSSWSALGNGTNGGVYCLAMNAGDLYIGGSFSTADGINVNKVAKWDGNSWSGFASGVDGYTSVSAIAVKNNDVYIGGSFTSVSGVPANNVARWNGTNWSSLGSGLSGFAIAMLFRGTDLFVGGNFMTAGGIIVNNIAKWDGNAWAGIGSGMNGHVAALAADNNFLYAAGFFNLAGGTAANDIAKWDGNIWSPLGSGLRQYPYAGFYSHSHSIALSNNGDVYVGGVNSIAGDKAAPYFAIYRNNPLPVKCTNFNYQYRNDNILLSWTIRSEYNSSHFEIQRSFDGRNFEKLSSITSTGVGVYDYTDHITNIDAASVYYRLKQVDKNGNGEFVCTTLRVLTKTAGYSLLSVYPNPAQTLVTINYPKMIMVTITDLSGRVLQTTKMASTNSTILNLSGLPKGNYLVKAFNTGMATETQQLVIQ